MKLVNEKKIPEKEYLELIMSSSNKVKPNDENLNVWYDYYKINHAERLAFDLEYLCKDYRKKKGIRVLEVGPIPPILTVAMKKKGFLVTGIDVFPKRFEESINANKLNILKADLENDLTLFKENSFDVIIMNEVFEHLNLNLISLFDNLYRILDRKGKLYLSSPNLKSINGIYNFLFLDKAYSTASNIYDEYLKIEKLGHMGHVREYTPKELKEFLMRFGFNVDRVIHRGKYSSFTKRIISTLFYRYKPFFSIVCEKK